jgi:hypothetical protein
VPFNPPARRFVAQHWRSGLGVLIIHLPNRINPPKEPTMNRITTRFFSVSLAALMTLATLGGINQIAVHESAAAAAAPAAMAAGKVLPRA